MAKPQTIVFFHPDLGIGGAERLVVDAAVGLQRLGHRVVIYTNHCDANHCFDECRNGTLQVRVAGNSIFPPSINSRLSILCALARHVHLVLSTTAQLAALAPDAFFVDQLSGGLPLLRLLYPRVPILFYCHYPDLLLVRGRASWLKRAYRLPFDALEQWSMRFAHAVAVNSQFTKSVVQATWPRLAQSSPLIVIYPCVDTHPPSPSKASRLPFNKKAKMLLSINRFEPKKDIGLAIKAFAALPPAKRRHARLILAGGYDSRVAENVSYHAHLQSLATALHLSHQTMHPNDSYVDAALDADVIFLLSISNPTKQALLAAASCVIYTPANEHFGIVPLEAMLANCPVLAADSGGPVETVTPGRSGWLCDPANVDAWTQVLARVLDMPHNDLRKMGQDGATRVKSQFSRDQMANTLDKVMRRLVHSHMGHKPPVRLGLVPLLLAALMVLAAFALALLCCFVS
ncbi:hypothetical protein CDD82_2510 [Ophiocordyceps australis]|uniref:Alpha-1,3/1,6-mannosyltransferase ALG2 n=1 Tax=Ophiocordyceps australis TaxID=1399860 RepID=A0A2C5XW21_9HYPO|nr:hypothetical protein CDD82_2510 [Ophiocordyceps australis]